MTLGMVDGSGVIRTVAALNARIVEDGQILQRYEMLKR
jgi:hypothetical protein